MSGLRTRLFYFGPEDRALFGSLHLPGEGANPDIGVVLCNAFGYEAICAHRMYRQLAHLCAEAGFATLRFDYDGTRDSAGDSFDPHRLQASIASIHFAIDALQAHAGVRQVYVVGLRLGAALGALAAENRANVAGLVAIAPVLKGRAFLRELRALSLAGSQTAPPEWAVVRQDIQEAAGFILTEETQRDFAEIDLTARARIPAPRVLLLERDDLPRKDGWATRLQNMGAQVERRAFSGYDAMMAAPHENVVPQEMLSGIVAWIGHQAANSTIVADTDPFTAVSSGTDPTRERLSCTHGGVRESIVYPDPENRLGGILAEPDGPMIPGRTPRNVVLLLNAGAISRIGPARMYVMLARQLARKGVAVLRLDLSGIGDSPPPVGQPENVVYNDSALADIQHAAAFLRQRYGNARYHVAGICSGGYHGFKAAVAGSSFDTAVVINPLTFFWKEGMSLDGPARGTYRSSTRRFSNWLKLVRGDAPISAVLGIGVRRVKSLSRNLVREIARRLRIRVEDDLAKELHEAARRTQRLYFVFAASDPGLQMLQEQGGSAVPQLMRGGKIKVDVVAGADHTFTAHWSRDRLAELLAEHLAVAVAPGRDARAA